MTTQNPHIDVGGREKGLQNRSFERYAIRQKAEGYGHARKNEGDID